MLERHRATLRSVGRSLREHGSTGAVFIAIPAVATIGIVWAYVGGPSPESLALSAASEINGGNSGGVTPVAAWLVPGTDLATCRNNEYLVRHVGLRLPPEVKVVLITDKPDPEAALPNVGPVERVIAARGSLPRMLQLLHVDAGPDLAARIVKRWRFSREDEEANPDSVVTSVVRAFTAAADRQGELQ